MKTAARVALKAGTRLAKMGCRAMNLKSTLMTVAGNPAAAVQRGFRGGRYAAPEVRRAGGRGCFRTGRGNYRSRKAESNARCLAAVWPSPQRGALHPFLPEDADRFGSASDRDTLHTR